MTLVLDDLESRPGSTASALRTFIGLYLRRLGGRIAIADLVRLMADLDVPAARTRTAVARLRQRGLLIGERADGIGYRLDPAAVPMLERGDRRIFAVHRMAAGDPWCLVSFSIPESRRDMRHQLRRRLQWIGCGAVAAGLWICPGHLQDEAEEILGDLDAWAYATVFRTDTPVVHGSLPEAVARWWDLDALAAEHRRFQTAVTPLLSVPVPDGRDAFVAYLRLIDSWRILPYLDPGLPAGLLPADWPGERSVELYTELAGRLADRAWMHVEARTRASARTRA